MVSLVNVYLGQFTLLPKNFCSDHRKLPTDEKQTLGSVGLARHLLEACLHIHLKN